jgi:dienelactone hydrolase
MVKPKASSKTSAIVGQTSANKHERALYNKQRNQSQANQEAVSTYIAYPPDKSTKNAILIITDVIGHKFINAQVLADEFAANGYFVVMPDMFNGDSVPLNRPEGFNIMDWVKNHSPIQTEPIIDMVLKEMRESLGCQRIGGVGYCFGGKYVCRYLRPGQLDVGYIAHPTMLEAEELRGVEGPLSIAAAGELSF